MAFDFQSITGSALNIGVIIGTIILALIFVTVVVILMHHWRKYNEFKIVIWEKDGFGQWNEKYDVGGIFVDKKTNNKRLFLKKTRIGLTADTVPYLPSKRSLFSPGKTVHVIKTGLKNFHYIRINPNDPTNTLTVGEEDVNWAINAYERQKKLFQQSMWMQLMPYFALIFVAIIITIIFIYFFKQLSTLQEFGRYMKETAQIMLQMKSGVQTG